MMLNNFYPASWQVHTSAFSSKDIRLLRARHITALLVCQTLRASAMRAMEPLPLKYQARITVHPWKTASEAASLPAKFLQARNVMRVTFLCYGLHNSGVQQVDAKKALR